ncbi:hypothetical protein BWI17_07965 [Betaproteobacteria bacterium GR16-43]|nr:hypothetical protein BWI17_07965 [Betaproteobacteria bacterium GR16-43]
MDFLAGNRRMARSSAGWEGAPANEGRALETKPTIAGQEVTNTKNISLILVSRLAGLSGLLPRLRDVAVQMLNRQHEIQTFLIQDK